MLALRCEDGFPLSVEQVDIGADNESMPEPVRAFRQVVKEEALGHAAGSGGSAAVHLIYAGNAKAALLGMLSPRTIVVPARDYSGSDDLGCAWARDGLRDPVESPEHITAHQLMTCSRFVARLEKTLRDHADDLETGLADTLAGLLHAFRGELDAIPAGDVLAQPEEKRRELVTGNDLPVLYEAVNCVWQLNSRDRESTASDATVAVTTPTAGPFKRVVLADAALETTLDKAPSRIYLMGSYMLSDFLRDPDGFASAQAEGGGAGHSLSAAPGPVGRGPYLRKGTERHRPSSRFRVHAASPQPGRPAAVAR